MNRPPALPRSVSAAAPKPLPKAHEHKGNRLLFRTVLGTPRVPREPPRADSPPEAIACASPAGPRRPSPEPCIEAAADQAQRAPAAPDPLDPMARVLAAPVGRPSEGVATRDVPAPLAVPDEVVLDRVVRRLSWGGTGKRGTARIELGAGSLAGATLLLHADGRELTLEVEGGDAEAVQAFALRLGQRLGHKGILLRDVRQV